MAAFGELCRSFSVFQSILLRHFGKTYISIHGIGYYSDLYTLLHYKSFKTQKLNFMKYTLVALCLGKGQGNKIFLAANYH